MAERAPRDWARPFADAARGVAHLLAREPNARVHALATLAALGLGAWLGIGALEWCAVLFAVGLVWVAEAHNTALEELADAVHPGRDARVGRAKDMAAGGVLVAAAVAVAIGALVFGPRLLAAWVR